MPPHLHPRSTATSALFAGTLLASFIVVGIPHVFPCPRPRKGYADSERQLDADGKPIPVHRKRKEEDPRVLKSRGDDEKLARPQLANPRMLEDETTLFRQLQQEAEMLEKEARKCPVPKPRGVLGRLLGVEDGKGQQQEKGKS